ncbi:hypothetical protein SPFM9_00191 [Salmonella phage SPFM9]|nr:hypothetical protein SPFM9_00191 [Salmonella phage SPFM9]
MSEMRWMHDITKFGYPLAEQRKVVPDYFLVLRSTFSHDGRTHRVRIQLTVRAKHGSCSLHFRVSAVSEVDQVDIDAKYLGGGVKLHGANVSKNGDLEDVAQALRGEGQETRRMFYRELQLCTAAPVYPRDSCA